MPEPSPESGSDIATALADDEHRHALTPASAGVMAGGVLSGPETERIRRQGLGIGGWLCVAWLIVILFMAFFGSKIPGIPDPVNDVTTPRLGWGASGHPFGTDGQGRDVLSLIVNGTYNSMYIGIVSVFFGLVVGGVLGIVAGYFKGTIGGVLGGMTDILLAYPQLVLALSVVTFLGNSVFWVTVALAIVSVPVLARISRASTLSWSEREFVIAARSQGAKHGRVMSREVFPNVLPAMFSIALLGVAVVIVAEAGLAIIGAGVKPAVVTWGNVIVSGATELRDSPHIVLSVSIVIFLTVLSLNYLGDVVRARTDVRE